MVRKAMATLPAMFSLGRPSKNKNCEISDICQISVTLPTLYPDMDIKKFRHIFLYFNLPTY